MRPDSKHGPAKETKATEVAGGCRLFGDYWGLRSDSLDASNYNPKLLDHAYLSCSAPKGNGHTAAKTASDTI